MTHLLVFLSAALYEGLFLLWGGAASKGHAARAALWSAAVGALSVYGMSSVVHDVTTGPALIGGYAVGSWVTVKWLSK